MNVSLLEDGKSDYHVTMHKFIRQVALYISEDNPECKHLVETNKEIREPLDDESWSEKNRISLGDNDLDRLPDSPNCSMLSTLFLQKNFGLEIIPPAFFEHMINLRVLDLSHTGITSLPLSLAILISLKVLHLNNCTQLVELPSHIAELVHLESLDIHGSGITCIPPHIEKLIFLKRLWVSFGNGNNNQDVSFNYDMISKLSRLEELVVDVKSPEQWTNEVVENVMTEVATLKKFKRLKVCFSNRVVDVIEIAPMTVRILVPEARILTSYIRRSSWGVVRKIGPFRFCIGCQNSEFCQNPNFVIYKKYFKYCNGAGSNTPILEVLAEAEGFELVNHKDIRQLSDFGTANMNKIQGCLIEGCDAIESIMDTVGGVLLPNLEQLFVKNLPMLRSIWKEGPLQPGSLTKLTRLVLSNCRTLEKVFPLGALQKLCEIRYLKVEKCNEIEEIIPEADAVGNLPVLPKLEVLILLDMAKLRSICAIQSLEWPSLEKLEIFKCPGLCRLPFNEGNSANLEHIEAEQEWWGALQWQNQEDKEGLQKLCIFRSCNDQAP
jgi:disease resistance protein RPS2